MEASLLIRPGIGAIVYDATGRVLLHRRRVGDGWAPPSGRLEPGETVLEGLRRELREETGLEVQVRRLVRIYSDPSYQMVRDSDGSKVHFVTSLFQCGTAEGIPTASDEGTAWMWFPVTDLPWDLLPYAKVWLRDAAAGGVAVQVR